MKPSEPFSQMMSALQAGKIEESIFLCKEILRSDSGSSRALDSFQEGEEGLSLAIEQQKKNFEVRTQRGVLRLARAIVLFLEGKDAANACKSALDDFTKATALRPDSIAAHINTANVLIFSARYARFLGKNAAELFQMALDELVLAHPLDPSNEVVLHNRGTVFFYLGQEARRSGGKTEELYLKAIDDITAALNLNATDAYAHKNLGIIKVALAKLRMERKLKVKELYDQALEHLNHALVHDEGLYGAWFERGHVHFALKRFPEAIRDWEHALQIDRAREETLKPLMEEARDWAKRKGQSL